MMHAPVPQTVETRRFQPRSSFSKSNIAWVNRAVRRHAAWSMRLGERALSIQHVGLAAPDTVFAADSLDLVFIHEKGACTLCIERPLVDELLNALQPGLSLPEGQARVFLLEAALDPLMTLAEAVLGLPLELSVVQTPGPVLGPMLAFDISYGKAKARGWVRLPAVTDNFSGFYRTILEKLDHLATRPFSVPRDVPVGMRLELGTLTLAVTHVRSLERGDVLIPEDWPLPRGLARLRVGPFVAPVVLQESRIVLSDILRMKPPAMEPVFMSSPPNDAAATPPVDLDSIDMSLTFEFGRWPITIGEMKNLANGYVFDLGRPIDGPIDIIANGKVLGRGEIVQIGDRLGVRLIEGFDRHD